MPVNPSCTLCPLHRTATHRCIEGEARYTGTIPVVPNVMIIGQGPGAEEDQQGRPFVGPSGQLLQETLTWAGISSAYFTNATRCFPGAQKVGPAMSKACAPYLDEEIADLKPDFILTLGNEATQRILGRGRVTEIAGQETWSEKYHAWIMPTLHPAAILRNRGRESSWRLDFARFAMLIRGKLLSKPPVQVNQISTSFEAGLLAGWLSQPGVRFTYDFETNAVPWWHKDFKPLSVAFSLNPAEAYVLPLAHKDSPITGRQAYEFFQLMQGPMTDPTRVKGAHNKIFDDLAVYRMGGYLPKGVVDTLTASHLVDENRPRGLKWLLRALYGWPDYGQGIPVTKLADQPLHSFIDYNGYDAAGTRLLLDDITREIDNQNLTRYGEFVGRVTESLERMIVRGLHVDEDTLKLHLIASHKRMDDARLQIPVDNPASAQQVGKWLYQDLGLPNLYRTANGSPSTAELALRTLSHSGYPQAQAVLDFRKPYKEITTYFVPVRQAVGNAVDGRFHMDLKPFWTETGRHSGGWHTTKRDPFVRSVYSAPPGWELISGDYAQIEARISAWLAAGGPMDFAHPWRGEMLRAFLDGRDVYVELAATLLGKPVSKVTTAGPDSDRQLMGKVPTLAILYNAGPKGIREYAFKVFEIEYTPQEARRMLAAFYDRWPEMRQWHATEEAILRARGWTRTLLGRMRRLPDAMSDNWATSGEAVRSGLNAPIQGLASDILQAAQLVFDEVISPEIAFPVGNHHDALLIQGQQRAVAPTVRGLQWVMERGALAALRPFGLHLPFGLLQAEIKIGPWGRGVSLDEYLSQ